MMNNTQQAPLTMAGRPSSFAERQYWQRLHDGISRTAVWLSVILTLFFAYVAAWSAWREQTFLEGLLTSVVLFPGVTLVAFYPRYRKQTVENALTTVWYNEQADKARLATGNIVTLWDDRATWTDLRGETTLFFGDVTLCTETVHGFLLQAGTANMLIRAADLTAEQVTAVRERLMTAIPRECYRQKCPAMGCLHEALPLPVFENNDEVFSRTAVEVALPHVGKPAKRRRRMARMFVTPCALIYGCALADVIAITGQYLLDMVLLCALAVTVMNALLIVLTIQKKTGKTTVYVAMTRDGVALFENGRHYFYVWERLKQRENAHHTWLIFPEGESLKLG